MLPAPPEIRVSRPKRSEGIAVDLPRPVGKFFSATSEACGTSRSCSSRASSGLSGLFSTILPLPPRPVVKFLLFNVGVPKSGGGPCSECLLAFPNNCQAREEDWLSSTHLRHRGRRRPSASLAQQSSEATCCLCFALRVCFESSGTGSKDNYLSKKLVDLSLLLIANYFMTADRDGRYGQGGAVLYVGWGRKAEIVPFAKILGLRGKPAHPFSSSHMIFALFAKLDDT
jgi:hypothetical protein